MQHIALLQSCLDTLAPHPSNCSEETKATVPAPVVLVFYSHHVPRYADRDLRLFVEAKERGWVCEEMAVEKYPVCCTSSHFMLILSISIRQHGFKIPANI